VDSLFNVNPAVPSPITTPRDQITAALSLKHCVSSISKETQTNKNKPGVKLTNEAYELVTLASPYLAEDLPGGSTEFTSRTKGRPATYSIYVLMPTLSMPCSPEALSYWAGQRIGTRSCISTHNPIDLSYRTADFFLHSTFPTCSIFHSLMFPALTTHRLI
jgi:hypothetical protein